MMSEELDTIVCPAQEWGVKKVLLKQHRWYAIPIKTSRIPNLKYLAIYEKKPVKAIRYLGEIKEIRPYKNSRKYEIILKGPPKKIELIRRSKKNSKLAPQSRQYTSKKLIDNAKLLEDIFGEKLKLFLNQ